MLTPAFLFGAIIFAAPASAAITPHEAQYDLSLVTASDTIGPRAMDGVLEQSIVRACGGWETRSRITINAVFRDDIASTNERIFTSWESDDGTRYRFAVETRKNKVLVESFKGTARLGKKGGEAVYEATVENGRKLKVPLPRGTFLPVAYERALLTHAADGDKLFSGVVLNGESSNGPRVWSTAIGRRAGEPDAGTPERRDLDSQLLGPAWPMSSAYFNLFEKNDTPVFETEIRAYDSGVIDEVKQTFRDFSIAAHLTYLKRLAEPACGRG